MKPAWGKPVKKLVGLAASYGTQIDIVVNATTQPMPKTRCIQAIKEDGTILCSTVLDRGKGVGSGKGSFHGPLRCLSLQPPPFRMHHAVALSELTP